MEKVMKRSVKNGVMGDQIHTLGKRKRGVMGSVR